MAEVDVLSRADVRRIPLIKEANAEPIPGYRLIEPLGRGGCGEVWKCEAPGGLTKAIKFVNGNLDGLEGDTGPAAGELRALQLVKAIRHPFLLSLERVEVLGGELVIVMELADRSLRDVLDEHSRAGQPGIPRERLLGYLREAAEALDVMNLQHGLQHLDVKPGNLFLVSDHVKVADFGLVSVRTDPGAAGRGLGSVTPLYASPESFDGSISPYSDQYSLAIVYLELLTQTLPFSGQNVRQLLVQHTREEPDLDALPRGDRAVVARALAKDPGKRYPTCSAFIRALADVDDAAAEGIGVHCVGLPDYRFLECLAASPLAEAWKAQAPDGRQRLVQFVYGFSRREGEWEAVLRFKALRHPSLRPVEVVQYEPGRLVLVGNLVGKSLHDRLRECQAQGQRGIPRGELLGHLRVAAETLEQLHRQHGTLHLGLNPRALLLDEGRLVLSDMGLAHLLWGPGGQPVAPLNARYAAPELFEGRHDPSADQFSLAALYQELLTGQHPFPEPPPGQAAGRRPRVKPNLGPLSKADRAVIARALDPDPRKRWSNCPEFVLALSAAAAPAKRPAPRTPAKGTPAAPPGAGAVEKSSTGEEFLRRRYKARLPVEVIRPRLDAFRLQWHGAVECDDPGHLVFHVNLPRSFWQRWLGRQAGLEVDLRLTRAAEGPAEVLVRIRSFGCGRGPGGILVGDLGALLLESLRTYLQVNPERRIQERLIWPHPIVVRAISDNGQLGEVVEAQGKDISQSGIGFYLPERPRAARVRLELTPQGRLQVNLAASVARVQRCGDSWFEVGALFATNPGQQKVVAELCAG